MGTRGLTVVIKDGETKVAQYGQWDHYPSGQGVNALRILREEGLIDKLRANVDNIPEATDETWKQAFGDAGVGEVKDMVTLEEGQALEAAWPELVRDTATNILKLIAEGKVRALQRSTYPVADGDIWIEGQFIVDLDENQFITLWDDRRTVIDFAVLSTTTDEEYILAAEGAPDED